MGIDGAFPPGLKAKALVSRGDVKAFNLDAVMNDARKCLRVYSSWSLFFGGDVFGGK